MAATLRAHWAIVLIAMISTGCCSWCHRHCCPQQPVYQSCQPTYQPAYCAPTCQAPTAYYPTPVTATTYAPTAAPAGQPRTYTNCTCTCSN